MQDTYMSNINLTQPIPWSPLQSTKMKIINLDNNSSTTVTWTS